MCIDLNRHEDRKMLKEIIAEVNIPQFNDLNLKLNSLKIEVDYIKKQTTETNGKVKKHESLLNEIKKEDEIHSIQHQHDVESRIITCPHSNTITELKEKNSFKTKTRQRIVAALGTILVALSITLATINITDNFESSNEKNQTEQLEKIIEILEENDIVVD
ncbi:MAG: hypothetical protein ACOC22_00385 [bacterium]